MKIGVLIMEIRICECICLRSG